MGLPATSIGHKTIIPFVLIFVVLTLYDVLWDLLLTLLHSMLVLLHIIFEFCEHALDLLIEHLFHTDPHTTEIIVFYILASIIGCITFKLIMALRTWYCRFCKQLTGYYHQEKTRTISKLRNQPLIEKIKWGLFVSTSSVVIVVLAFS